MTAVPPSPGDHEMHVSLRDLLQGTAWWKHAAQEHPGVLVNASAVARDAVVNSPVPGGQRVWQNALARALGLLAAAARRDPTTNRDLILIAFDYVDDWAVIADPALEFYGIERNEEAIAMARGVQCAATVQVLRTTIEAAATVRDAVRILRAEEDRS